MLDTDYIRQCLDENAQNRVQLTEGLRAIGVKCDESHTNFVLARFDSPKIAKGCNTALNAEGLIVRPVASYNLPRALRITIGTMEDCARVLHCIKSFIASQNA